MADTGGSTIDGWRRRTAEEMRKRESLNAETAEALRA